MARHLLKFTLAFALCYFLFTNGKLDFSLVFKSFHLGPIWVMSAITLFCHYLATSLRFKVLLQSKSVEKVSFLKVFAFDAIGSFFSLVIPGSAGSDVVRFIYYRKVASDVSSSTKGSLLLLDRFIGLLNLMLLSVVLCFVQLDYLLKLTPKFLSLFYFYILISIFLGLIIFLAFSDSLFKRKTLSFLSAHLGRFPKINQIMKDVLSVELSFKVFLKCCAVSMLNQGLVILAFWGFTSPFLPAGVTFLNLCTIIPVGLLGVAMPISPAGLGVGHVIFDNLFKLFGVDNGASLYNIYFVMNAAFYLMGVFPYLLMKKEDSNNV